MPFRILREQAGGVARLLKAVANARRLSILCELAEGEKTVTDLQNLIGISQSALSQHLARLRRDELVATRRDAQNIYYRLDDQYVPDLLGYLERFADVYDREAANDRRPPAERPDIAAE
ncbi:MAG: helix-turn-helix transcriptional regulator [Alphaproteobacteria bacterium]|nr:helix-turn-helix transcriptional regulator [Alphaproteobacteria bacterium SS10]